jgi:hypothetical protein
MVYNIGWLRKSAIGKYRMRLLKIIVTACFIASLADVNVLYNAALQKQKSGSENKQLIASDFENVISAVILPRENQTARKAADPTGLPKPALTASDCLSAKNRSHHNGNFKLSHVTINELTLVSLHCLLAV